LAKTASVSNRRFYQNHICAEQHYQSNVWWQGWVFINSNSRKLPSFQTVSMALQTFQSKRHVFEQWWSSVWQIRSTAIWRDVRISI
jgi:hypothetical protein